MHGENTSCEQTTETETIRMEELPGKDDAVEAVEISQTRNMLFPVHTAPNPLLWPFLALQYLLMIIPVCLATAVLLADQLGCGDTLDVRSELFSIGLFTCGVATLLQILAGCRLPTLEGMNTVYIVPIAAIVQYIKLQDEIPQKALVSNATENAPEQWKHKMSELQGNLLLASATHFLLGVTGITGLLLRFIGPVTLAPTIMLVGVSISGFMIPLCEQHWGIASLSIILVVIFSLMLSKVNVPVPVRTEKNKLSVIRYPLFQLNAVILALGLSWLFSYVLTVTDVLPSNSTMHGHMARTDVRNNVLYTTPWFYLPRPFPFGMPTFSASGYVGMLTINLITILELMGGYFAVARVTDTTPPPVHAVNRGVAVNGLSCVICSVFGNITGSVPYMQIFGCVAVTKIASRAVFLTAACMMIVGGVVGKIGAALTLIPDPVISGVILVALGMLASVGISLLQHVDLSSTRNLMIIGMCVVLGLIIPDWMVRNQDIIKTGNDQVDQVLTVLLSTPMCITGVVGCVLDNLTPGTREERGILKWRQENAGSSMIYTTSGDVYELPHLTKLITRLKCCVFCPISPTFNIDGTCSSRHSGSSLETLQEQRTLLTDKCQCNIPFTSECVVVEKSN